MWKIGKLLSGVWKDTKSVQNLNSFGIWVFFSKCRMKRQAWFLESSYAYCNGWDWNTEHGIDALSCSRQWQLEHNCRAAGWTTHKFQPWLNYSLCLFICNTMQFWPCIVLGSLAKITHSYNLHKHKSFAILHLLILNPCQLNIRQKLLRVTYT